MVKFYYYFIYLHRKVNFIVMKNLDTILTVTALACLLSSVIYSAIKMRRKKCHTRGDGIRDKVVKISRAGEKTVPSDFDPSEEESGFEPVEPGEGEFEKEPVNTLEEYLDPHTTEERRIELAELLKDAGYDIR